MIAPALSSPATFPRHARFCCDADYRRVLRFGKRRRAPGVELFAHPAPDARGASDVRAAHSARIAILAARRVGNAVYRHRLKREVREWFRHARAQLPSLDFLVRLLPTAAPLSRGDLRKHLQSLAEMLRPRI